METSFQQQVLAQYFFYRLVKVLNKLQNKLLTCIEIKEFRLKLQ